MTPEDRIELPEPTPSNLVKNSRRRLLRGGMAAAPALLTLVNRPVMAAHCSPASAHVSANSRMIAPVTCSGLAPMSWSQESSLGDWPSPMALPGDSKSLGSRSSPASTVAPSLQKGEGESANALPDSGLVSQQAGKAKGGTTFNSVFGSQGGYGNATLLEVLRLNSNGGRDGLARHLVAAYLNALKGYTPAAVLDVVTTKSIWASFVARGYYEPTAGIRWYPDYAEPANPRGGLIAWLKTTMPR